MEIGTDGDDSTINYKIVPGNFHFPTTGTFLHPLIFRPNMLFKAQPWVFLL